MNSIYIKKLIRKKIFTDFKDYYNNKKITKIYR